MIGHIIHDKAKCDPLGQGYLDQLLSKPHLCLASLPGHCLKMEQRQGCFFVIMVDIAGVRQISEDTCTRSKSYKIILPASIGIKSGHHLHIYGFFGIISF